MLRPPLSLIVKSFVGMLTANQIFIIRNLFIKIIMINRPPQAWDLREWKNLIINESTQGVAQPTKAVHKIKIFGNKLIMRNQLKANEMNNGAISAIKKDNNLKHSSLLNTTSLSTCFTTEKDLKMIKNQIKIKKLKIQNQISKTLKIKELFYHKNLRQQLCTYLQSIEKAEVCQKQLHRTFKFRRFLRLRKFLVQTETKHTLFIDFIRNALQLEFDQRGIEVSQEVEKRVSKKNHQNGNYKINLTDYFLQHRVQSTVSIQQAQIDQESLVSLYESEYLSDGLIQGDLNSSTESITQQERVIKQQNNKSFTQLEPPTRPEEYLFINQNDEHQQMNMLGFFGQSVFLLGAGTMAAANAAQNKSKFLRKNSRDILIENQSLFITEVLPEDESIIEQQHKYQVTQSTISNNKMTIYSPIKLGSPTSILLKTKTSFIKKI
eukprot:403374662